MHYALPFIFSCVLSLFFTSVIRKIAIKYGRTAKPREDRWHSAPTALFGGVAIYLTSIIAMLFFAIPLTKEFTGLLAGGSLIFLMGVIDDFHPIKPYTKLMAQITAAVVVILFGIKMEMFSPIVSVPLTILWIVAITNAFNLLDNMDGLSAGIALITSVVLSIVSAMQNQWELVTLSLILGGACLGFLRYNFNPASIFMGDCGSMFLGFTIGALSIVGTHRHASNLIVTIAVPVLIVAVPIFDTALVTVMRKLTGRAVSQGGKDHISHRLVVLGLSEKQAVLVLYLLSIIIGFLAIISPHLNFYLIMVIGILVLVGLFYLGIFLGEVKVYSQEELDTAKEKIVGNGNKTILDTTIFYKRQIVEVLVDFALIVVAYVSAYLLRYEGTISPGNLQLIIKSLPILILVQLVSFYYFGLYKKIWRYMGMSDVVSIFKGVTLGTVITVAILVLTIRFSGYSRAVFIIYWLTLTILVTSVRGVLRLLREHFAEIQKNRGKRVIILGAGDAGNALLREIRNNPDLHYNVVGFIDDDPGKIGRKIYGKSVIGSGKDLSMIAKETDAEEVLIAVSNLSEEDLNRIVQLCGECGLPYRRMGRIL